MKFIKKHWLMSIISLLLVSSTGYNFYQNEELDNQISISNDLISENSDLTTQRDYLEEQLGYCISQKQELEDELGYSNGTINDFDYELQDQTNSNYRLEDEIDDLEREIRNLKYDLEECEDDLRDCN
jgi:chromosome segregation ATPase